MNPEPATQQQPQNQPASAGVEGLNLHDRRHRLNPPRTFKDKLALRVKDGFESWIARASVHGDPPIYDAGLFPWARDLEDNWQAIRRELEQVMERRHDMPNFHDILSQVSTITQDDQWKTYFLIGPGMDCQENRRQCPETSRLLNRVPGVKTAMFSILSPRKHIPPHRGPYNGVLRLHLGLLVPEPKEQCRIRIADQTRHWEEGRCLIFDDTFNHEVWNDTGGHRVVLFVDFERPLKFPASAVNRLLLKAAGWTPFLRAAGNRHKKWEKNFYRK